MAPGMCSPSACRILFMPALQPPLETTATRHRATEEEIEGNFVLQLKKCEPFPLSQHASKHPPPSQWNLEQCDCTPQQDDGPGPSQHCTSLQVIVSVAMQVSVIRAEVGKSDILFLTRCFL